MDSREVEEIFEGVRQQFTFEDAHLELATLDRVDDIIHFMTASFIPDTPVLTAVGYKYDDLRTEDMRERVCQKLSILLVSNITNEVIGIVISHYMEKEKGGPTVPVKYEPYLILRSFFGQKDGEMTVFDKYGVTRAIRIAILGVDRRFRSKGIGAMLLKAALAFFRERETGPIALKAECLNKMSDAIFVKQGFELLHELPYAEFQVDGKSIFEHISGAATIRVKKM